MTGHNGKQQIRELYDVLSPYYQALWGEHIHHGYWVRGDESKEVAQEQLIEYLAKTAGIGRGCKILDVGCGMGGSSIHLAKRYAADVTGITISPVQIEMATRAAAQQKTPAKFLLMDAEALDLKEQFDFFWAVESVSHFQDIPRFFASAAKALKTGGRIALIDWFKRENLDARQERKWIAPIEKTMLVELRTMGSYDEWLRANDFQVKHREILNQYCARSWDVGIGLVKDKKLWALAARQGSHFLTHIKGLRAMRAGYASGAFVYGLLVAEKA